MVEDERFPHLRLELLEAQCVEQHRVPAEAGGHARDGVGRAFFRARDLAQGGAGDQSRRHGPQQLRSLAVIRSGERLRGKPLAAGRANEPLDTFSPLGGVPSILGAAVAGTRASVLAARRPGAKRRLKRAPVLDGGLGPVHGATLFKTRARTHVKRSDASSESYVDAPPDRNGQPSACGQRGVRRQTPISWTRCIPSLPSLFRGSPLRSRCHLVRAAGRDSGAGARQEDLDKKAAIRQAQAVSRCKRRVPAPATRGFDIEVPPIYM